MKHFVQACMVMGATVFYLLMLKRNINLKEKNLKKIYIPRFYVTICHI